MTWKETIPRVNVNIAVEQNGVLVYRYISKSGYDIDVVIQWRDRDTIYQLRCKDFEAVQEEYFVCKVKNFITYDGQKRLLIDDKLG